MRVRSASRRRVRRPLPAALASGMLTRMRGEHLMALLLRARPFLVFVPWLVFVLSWTVKDDGAGAWMGLLVAAGLIAWSWLEWIIHWAMHVPVRCAAASRFQDRAHLRHHREPHDVEHAVVMLRASIPLAVVFFGLSLLIFRDPAAALSFHAGLVLGYLAYEFVHLADHARWRIPGISALRRHHDRHHRDPWRCAYGVTSPLWDWIFGTLPQDAARGLCHPGRSGG